MRIPFLDRYLTPLVEAALLRLSKRGDISVTVRHVTEVSDVCKACDGSGRQEPARFEISGRTSAETRDKVFKLYQGICLGCDGRGRQP